MRASINLLSLPLLISAKLTNNHLICKSLHLFICLLQIKTAQMCVRTH
ncbi:hypothetical protein HMPREF3202_01938 [Prevotella bivia]|uniref:Uncharacterized protein n=1 Tax=Prevotella bivia TaxID=28125 RepID=A0A137SRY2_9BACT|nr:hypothetical protein HMPREF3202_01938 [Prevotella bivia]DAK13350.1 MAG TPA: hypothetical protein [Caudoviricetes sp.]DAK13857.1 MAG TPA: hypothetical protein [Caudoviricetes sp.]DAM70095.1 MAG TPA: hypothetical protein [Caudoviricetes sp.]DAO15136.1 MAG TPA: hypothetical protein [Caudoviricetes sp.]